MAVDFSNPKMLAKPPGYSNVVQVSGPARIVYFAGQLGVDADNKFVGSAGDFRAQCEQAFDNMTLALKAAGAQWRDVVKINNFLVDIENNIATFRALRDRYVNAKAPPASTTVGVPALARPGGLFEIEAIAVLPEKSAAKAVLRAAKKKVSRKKRR